MNSVLTSTPVSAPARVPRLGFLGVGWIGLLRLQSLARSGAGTIAAVADPVAECRHEARRAAPSCALVATLGELLALELDGIVIATPSALHAEQAVHALEHGLAVFCQKPLGRTAAETRRVIAAARAADRLLAVDLSYRHTQALRRVRDLVRSGAIGGVHAVDLVFHNAYGPSRAWARDPALAGGGCTARIACSWEASIGRGAIIEALFHGAHGTAAFRNVNGSFFDFTAELYHGAESATLSEPPDDWGGGALVDWTRRLADDPHFDASVEALVDVAATLDRMLGR